jgi:hypothetical protein
MASSARAVPAAKDQPACLSTVSYDLDAAVGAGRRECLYRTLEAVEHVRISILDNFEGFVVLVTTNFALSHSDHSVSRSSLHGVLTHSLPR